jgi:bla regulator protein blaR1
VAEREHASDEEVVKTAGVAHALAFSKRLLLAATGLAVVAGPGAIGFLHVPVGRAQSQAAKPLSFEVASVKPSRPPADGHNAHFKISGGPGTKDPSRFACENYDLASLIEKAYDVPYYRLSAPAWTEGKRFDIIANVPEGATKEQFRLMQQNLLVERFKLVVHREKKEMPQYELVVAKSGLKLKEASAGEAKDKTDESLFPDGMKTDAEGFPILPPGHTMYVIVKGHARLQASGETMEHFASTLASQLRESAIDATGLTGKYDFTLSWLPEDFPSDADTAPTLLTPFPSNLA